MEFNYFEGRPHDVPLEHRRRINAQIHERFRIRDLNNPLDMSISEFVRLYRMPQDAVVRLCELIQPYVPQHTSPQQTSLLRKVLVTLSLLGGGTYQRQMGRSMDCAVSQTSVSRHVREVIMALNHPDILTQFIRFPLTHEERVQTIIRNERLGMPRVLGFVDGFLLRVAGIRKDNERQAYWSRKGYLALNVQIICDADLRILNVDARFPGSCNDAYIWNASAAKQVVERAYWEDRCWLLGDSGYHTAPWMHVPLPHAEPGTPEYYYTKLHCHCRNAVERCIGCLKERWRLLGAERAVHYGDPEYAGCFVNASCVLHNYCMDIGLPHIHPARHRPYAANEDQDPPLPEHDRAEIRRLGLLEMGHLIDYTHLRRMDMVAAGLA